MQLRLIRQRLRCLRRIDQPAAALSGLIRQTMRILIIRLLIGINQQPGRPRILQQLQHRRQLASTSRITPPGSYLGQQHRHHTPQLAGPEQHDLPLGRLTLHHQPLPRLHPLRLQPGQTAPRRRIQLGISQTMFDLICCRYRRRRRRSAPRKHQPPLRRPASSVDEDIGQRLHKGRMLLHSPCFRAHSHSHGNNLAPAPGGQPARHQQNGHTAKAPPGQTCPGNSLAQSFNMLLTNNIWCAGRDLNPYGLSRQILSLLCLPIPSPAPGVQQTTNDNDKTLPPATCRDKRSAPTLSFCASVAQSQNPQRRCNSMDPATKAQGDGSGWGAG